MLWDGPYLYNVNTIMHTFMRNLVVINGGYFVESGVEEYGLVENTDSLNDFTLGSFSVDILLQHGAF